MLGDEKKPVTLGLVPRCLRALFDFREHHADVLKITLTVSALEIYNEKLCDLLHKVRHQHTLHQY